MAECSRIFNETGKLVSEKEERFWNAAFVVEITVVFLLNAFTLAIYTRNRHLRKRSTFLIINLTVADLLVGIVFGLSPILEPDNLERERELKQAFSWQSFVYLTLRELFLVASLANISLISLERLHATLFPFRHCLVGKRVYLNIILCMNFVICDCFSLFARIASVSVRICSSHFPHCSHSHTFKCYNHLNCEEQSSLP